MPDSHRSNDSPTGRIAVAVLIALSVGLGVFFTEVVSDIYARREVTPPGCTEGGDCGPQGNKADILSARAAEDVVDLTVVQVWFALVGLALLGWTLKATRDAVREANEATEAARRAVQVTEDGQRRELQAYVHIDRAELHWGNSQGTSPSITIHAKNTGQTPAKWFGVRVVVVASDFLIDRTLFDSTDWRARELIQWSALGGQSETSLPGFRVDDVPTMREAFVKQAVVHVLGAVQYETTFGEIVETEFWFCRKPHHRYRSEPVGDSTKGIATFNRTTEIPNKMQKVAASLRTYCPLEAK